MFLQPKDSINSRLVNPFVLRSFVGIVNIAQGTSTMISYLVENPSILTQIVFSNNNEQEFNHLAFSVIPSIFNYFSSQEMVTFAVGFYLHAIEAVDSKKVVKLLFPFLNSSITEPFISATMHQFFSLYTIDDQKMNSSTYKLILGEYAATLVRYCIKYLHLLPQEIIKVMKLLIDSRYSEEMICKIFFDHFVAVQAQLWSHKLVSKNKWQLFNIILMYIKNCTEELKYLIKCIDSTPYSAFSIPKFNSGFNKEPFEHFVCVSDMHLLARLLDKYGLLPSGLTINDFNDYNPKKKWCWFWVDVYIKSFTKKVREVSLFDGTGVGEAFDNLIESRFENQQLTSWHNRVVKHLVTSMNSTVNNIITSIPSKEFVTIQNIYFKYEFLFQNNDLKKLYFLSTIRIFIGKIKTSTLRDIFGLSKMWNPFVVQTHNRMELPSLDELISKFRPASQDAFIQVMKRFKIIDHVPLSLQFFLIANGLRMIDLIAEKENTGDTLYCLMLEHIESNTFLASFLLLSAFAMCNPIFSGLLTKKMIAIWSKCDSVILSYLSFDQPYMEKVISMTKKLISLGKPPPRLKKARSVMDLAPYY